MLFYPKKAQKGAKSEAKKMGFKTISEDGFPDYEVYTCDVCGHPIVLQGVGADISECPKCIARECEQDAISNEKAKEPTECVYAQEMETYIIWQCPKCERFHRTDREDSDAPMCWCSR